MIGPALERAAAGLTELVGSAVVLEYYTVEKAAVEDLPFLLGKPDDVVSLVSIEIRGGIRGQLLFFLGEEALERFAAGICRTTGLEPRECEIDAADVAREVANIVGNALLTELCERLNVGSTPSVPSYVRDLLYAVLDIMQIKYAGDFEHLGLVRAEFAWENENAGFFFSLLSPDVTFGEDGGAS